MLTPACLSPRLSKNSHLSGIRGNLRKRSALLPRDFPFRGRVQDFCRTFPLHSISISARKKMVSLSLGRVSAGEPAIHSSGWQKKPTFVKRDGEPEPATN